MGQYFDFWLKWNKRPKVKSHRIVIIRCCRASGVHYCATFLFWFSRRFLCQYSFIASFRRVASSSSSTIHFPAIPIFISHIIISFYYVYLPAVFTSSLPLSTLVEMGWPCGLPFIYDTVVASKEPYRRLALLQIHFVSEEDTREESSTVDRRT